jgi:hypothetical protein
MMMVLNSSGPCGKVIDKQHDCLHTAVIASVQHPSPPYLAVRMEASCGGRAGVTLAR